MKIQKIYNFMKVQNMLQTVQILNSSGLYRKKERKNTMIKISKENSSPFNSRQKQLERENNKLRQDLKTVNQFVSRLRSEIEELKNQVRFLNMQNDKIISKYKELQFTKMQGSPQSKSNKSLKLTKDFQEQMEVFTSESDSQTEQYSHFKPVSSLIHPLGKQKQKNVCFEQQNQFSSLAKQKIGSQIKLRGRANNEKSLKKIDSSNLFHPISYFDIDPDEDSTFTGINSKINSPKQNFFSVSHINVAKSERLINIGQRQLESKIKEEGKVREPSQQIFKKVSVGKPIYDVFFVTGLSKKAEPQVLYSYPKKSPHFDPILTLCYSDQFLKSRQNNTNSTKNLLNISNTTNQNKIKQFYVIPLRKADDSNTENQRQYLTVCQVEQNIIVERDNVNIPCTFLRLYCFISSCQFFNAFKNITNQFLDKINGMKNKNQHFLKEAIYKDVLKEALQQPLMILSTKSAESNHALSYRLDAFISISIDIPSIQNSYKLVSQFRPWGVMNLKVQIRPIQDYVSCLETKLFGVILAYGLAQKKIILFSNIKSKISECILHFLQIIKPLEYVCPVMMTALKEQHQEYFSAPMSLVLGLWVEQKKMQRQKIEIFMNRKQNLAGMIQKGKIQISDGIIINLDTGLIYGGGLSESLSSLGLKINQYYQNYCNHPKQIFKLLEKLFQNKINKNQTQIYQLSQKIKSSLEGTQLYSYYKQNKSKNHD